MDNVVSIRAPASGRPKTENYNTTLQAAVHLLTTGVILALLAGIALKLNIFGGGPRAGRVEARSHRTKPANTNPLDWRVFLRPESSERSSPVTADTREHRV